MNAKQRKTKRQLLLSQSIGIAANVKNILVLFARRKGLSALFAGAISATGFAPLNLWPLTLLALALLIHLVALAPDRKGAFRTGWLFGLGHFCVGLNWIAGAFRYQDAMPVWFGWVAVLLVSLYLATYPALTAWGAYWAGDRVRKTGRNSTLPFVFAFAAFWIITEWLRSWLFTGFAWNPLSATTLPAFGAQALPTIGTYGLSGWVILVSAAFWGFLAALIAGNKKALAARILDFALLSLAILILNLVGSGSPKGDPKNLQVRPDLTIVQPNIGQQDKYETGYEARNFAKLAELSRPLQNQGPRLLLWPEAAIPDYLEDGYPYRFYQFQAGESAAGARAQIASLMGPKDILLTGANRLVIDKQGQLTAARNSVSAMDAHGNLRGHYNKAHLVPYGEYLALRWLLEPLGASRLVPGNLDFIPGPGPQTLPIAGFGNAGIQICYEIIFSGKVIDPNNRPEFLFNPSNDAWFGSWGPAQHLAQARMRATEEAMPVIRSTPTGISAVIDANGRIVKSLPLGKSGRIDAKLPVAHSPTLFSRVGNLLSLGLAALLLAFGFLPVVTRRASR